MALRALTPPTGRGAYRPPCPALLARYAGCDARPVDPLGGLQPPALRAVPPASLHKEGGVKAFYPTGASPRSGRVRPGGQWCAGSVCAALEPPTSGRGLCTRGRGCSSDALTNHHFFMPAERASIPTRSGGCLAALQERPTALRSKA